MNALANAGQMTNQRYIDLTFIVAENEEEEEQRDYSAITKVSKAVINHSGYSCIGQSSCLKQKNIRKLYLDTLKQCEERNHLNSAASTRLEGADGSSSLQTAANGPKTLTSGA